VHARHTAAARLNPKVYGEKLQLGGAEDLPRLQAPGDPFDAAKRIAYLFAVAARRVTELPGPASLPASNVISEPQVVRSGGVPRA
jgi:hypothetical protein